MALIPLACELASEHLHPVSNTQAQECLLPLDGDGDGDGDGEILSFGPVP